jgi:glycosyltransferase involved in cell wall biosynthesis
MMGTRGVPAHYGGFETAVEEIGAGLASLGHEVVVYCRGQQDVGRTYKGMQRIVLPALRRRSLETLSHTGACVAHALRHRPDVALVFNAANAPWVATLRAAGIPTALHIDGHDSRRAKWSGVGRRYYTWATRWGSAVATEAVVDSAAIQHELEDLYDLRSSFIAYGARHADVDPEVGSRLLARLGLRRHGYHLVVARFEPENHLVEILRGYGSSGAALPLVVVGFAAYPGDYVAQIEDLAARDPRVRLLGAVWDQDLLDTLYGGAASYLHGHSVGGTNPSLLRAMAQEAPVLAFECPYNRETTGGHGQFWSSSHDLQQLVHRVEVMPEFFELTARLARRRVAEHYHWADVVQHYASLLHRLQAGPASEQAAAVTAVLPDPARPAAERTPAPAVRLDRPATPGRTTTPAAS